MTHTTLDDASLAYWREHVDEFIERVLVNPETGTPFVLLPAERTFLQHAFAIGPDGRLLYPTLIYSAIKKSGKTTFAAILVPTLLLLFGGRFAEAYCIANDKEQARARVFEAIKRIVEASPMLAGEADITANKISFPATGSTITAIPSDYAGAAGANPTISVFDELWGFTSERAWRLWDEFVPSPARKISCRLVVTHAGFSGESTLLEEMYKRGIEQPLIGTDLHAGDGTLCFWSHQPIAPWQTPEWIEQMRKDPSFRSNQFLRMIENRFVTNEENFIDLSAWDACAIARPVVADPSMSVWAAVDASTKRDSTGIAVFAWDRATKRPRMVWHRIFQPSPDSPLDFESTIEETLLGFKGRFQLRQVFYDPFQMAATAQRLSRLGVNMVEFPQTMGNITSASQNLYELIQGGNLIAYPDDEIRLALSRAIAVESARGWKIDKSKTSHKIDIVVAMGMAALAAVRKGGFEIRINGRTVAENEEHLARVRAARHGRRHAPLPARSRPAPDDIRVVHTDECGNEITAEQAQALRHRIGPPPRAAT